MITVNGQEVEWEEGMNVTRLLEKMGYNFPMLVIKVNGEVVKKDQWDDFLIPDGAEVKAIHLFGGG